MTSYTKTDQCIHYLSQILAKAGRTFVHQKEDDSHTNLYFDAEQNWIEGRWIETDKGKIKLVLRITDFCMLWVDEQNEALQTVSSVKKMEGEVIEQLSKIPHEFGLDTSGFNAPMHFEIPEYSFKGQPFQMINRHNLDEWMTWRISGNQACEKVLEILNVEGEIRIWPHHFDTGIYVQANEHLRIGFGFAMEDEMAGAPYFYMSGYPINGNLNYETVPELESGQWVLSEGYKGAILAIKEFEETSQAINKYIETALSWFLEQTK